jgi:hypothetical protein
MPPQWQQLQHVSPTDDEDDDQPNMSTMTGVTSLQLCMQKHRQDRTPPICSNALCT